MDLIVVVFGCPIHIPCRKVNLPVTMTRLPAQCVLQPEYIHPWEVTGTPK